MDLSAAFEMKIRDSKFHNNEKPFPGCLGRMVNLFDLTAGVTGNRLLTDKPHRDASPLSRSQSDVARIARPPFGDQLEDKMIVSNLRRSSSKNQINGTPIKMLIDQEMSKVDSKHSPPNVVAKLMGLESLPWEEPNLAVQRGHRKDYSQHICGHSRMPLKHWQLEDRLMDKEMLSEVHESPEKIEYKDIYESWRQSQRTTNVRDKTTEKGRWTEDVNEKKMALIRQKFMEAKRLSTDERLRQSKEFEDALEVLSSNKDLFLRFLDSQNLYELQSTPQPQPSTRRITVLKPSKMLDDDKSSVKGMMNDKQIKKPANVGQAAVWNMNPGYSSPPQKVDDCQVQHTRIVVLKPSSGKTSEFKAVVSPTCPSPRSFPSGNFHPKDDDVPESRKMAKEISCQGHEDLLGHQRDEALHSSVCSNGYTGDESSFNRSENAYAAGNFSELEVMSPSSRHSWDYVNRYNGPYSPSSFSRASYSPESSVCREAKKRLSERWAMIASNKGPQEQRLLRKSSSLGEMLALSDAKKSVSPEVEHSNKEQKPRECSNNTNEEIQVNDSPKNLSRSKSVPASSSTVYESGLGVEICDHEVGKVHDSKDLTKSKSMKSFKGRVTSLFFSRNKKATKEKSSLLQSKNEPQSTITEASVSLASSSGIIRDNTSQSISNGGFGECPLPTQYELSGRTLSDSLSKGQGLSLECGLTESQPVMPGISGENQDQPSPISVLEPLFRDDNAAQESLDSTKAGHMGTGVPLNSNLIDKSPPIESIARTLPWEDSCAEVTTRNPLKSLTVSIDPKVEEQDWLVSVQKLLSAAGLDDQVQSDSFRSRWHSLESPLDPSLRDKYANNEKEPLHEAKRRQRRSNQKLIFDYVNAALKEITGYESEIYLMGRMCTRSHGSAPEATSPLLVDLIVTQIKELISSEVHCVWGHCGDRNSLVVERFVRKEVLGKGWIELLTLETANLGKEIEGKLLEELVEEAVVDLTGRIL